MNVLLKLLPAAVLIAAAHADPQLPLRENEEFIFRVSWAIVPGAGEIKVQTGRASDPSGEKTLRVVTETSTRGLAKLLLPFQARSESLFSAATGRLLWLGESSSTRGKHDSHTVTFDYGAHTETYSDGQTRVLPLPPGYPTDLITCLVEAGSWNLQPGQSRDALVLFEDETYELTIHAVGTQSIVTPLGGFDTVVLEPRMEKTAPKGMFKRGSTVRVWVSTDPRHLPLRFRVEFKVGAGVANLVSYRGPRVPAAAAPAAPR